MNSVCRKYTFEAAHRLTRVPVTHKCRRLHGHSWHVEVHVEAIGETVLKSGIVIPHSALDSQGMVVDFDVIDKAWSIAYVVLDHNYLNEVPTLDNPTSEEVARYIYTVMQAELDRIQTGKRVNGDEEGGRPLRVTHVIVNETPRAGATYAPQWKEIA